jgi:hypothetical protein
MCYYYGVEPNSAQVRRTTPFRGIQFSAAATPLLARSSLWRVLRDQFRLLAPSGWLVVWSFSFHSHLEFTPCRRLYALQTC